MALLWSVIGLVLIGGLLALVFGPGRGMRADIARQRTLLQSQLAITQQQLDLTKRQLSVTETQLGVTQEQLRIAGEQRQIATEQLGIAQEQLIIARSQLGKTEASLEVQRRLQAIAEQTLQEAREINRKTPNAANPTSTARDNGLPPQP
jgi:hypothetical protein